MFEKLKPPDFTACPHWGKGGRYVVDPATGARVPVDAAADSTTTPATDGSTLPPPPLAGEGLGGRADAVPESIELTVKKGR